VFLKSNISHTAPSALTNVGGRNERLSKFLKKFLWWFLIPCTIMVNVPWSLFESAMVSGILSPFSSIRTITNCPAFRFAAILGASITNLLISAARNSAEIILFISGYFSKFKKIFMFVYKNKQKFIIKDGRF